MEGEGAAQFQYLYIADRRHERLAVPNGRSSENQEQQDWRMRERLKTVSVALVLCLNIGIDPPDVVKTSPCAKLECWVDPLSLPPQKALETIGRNLQQQYEVWQPRARYRLSLDPSVEETKKLCCSMRKNAKEERILFHYNGHGVPKPTPGGEIWVFNKNYTQYIPVSIYDIQTWLGSPCIYVFDWYV
jgi:regulator-associated protein of mTOR